MASVPRLYMVYDNEIEMVERGLLLGVCNFQGIESSQQFFNHQLVILDVLNELKLIAYRKLQLLAVQKYIFQILLLFT